MITRKIIKCQIKIIFKTLENSSIYQHLEEKKKSSFETRDEIVWQKLCTILNKTLSALKTKISLDTGLFTQIYLKKAFRRWLYFREFRII